MATKFEKVLSENGDLIKSLFGNIDNVIVKDNYDDVLKTLSEPEKRINEYNRYKKLNEIFNSTKLEDSDLYKTNKNLDYNNKDFSNPGMIIGDRYSKYLEKLRGGLSSASPNVNTQFGVGEGFAPPPVPLDNPNSNSTSFEEYLKNDPVGLAELQKYYNEEKVNIDPETIKATRYKKAGLTDEDIKFYEQYKPPYATEHNQNLADILLKHADNLKSTGSYGDNFAKLLANKLQGLQLPETVQPKYNAKFDEDSGQLIYYSDDPNTEPIVRQFKTPKEKLPEYDPIGIKQDENGKYIMYGSVWNPATGMFEDKKLKDANEQEIADFLLKQDKANKTGVYSKGGNKRGGKKSGKGSVQLTNEAKDLGTKLMKFGQLNKSFNAKSLDESNMSSKDKKLYRQLQKELVSTYFNNDYDKLNLYAEKVFKSSNKQVPKILQDLLGGKTTVKEEPTDDSTDNIITDNTSSEEDVTEDEIYAFDEMIDQIDMEDDNSTLNARGLYEKFKQVAKSDRAIKHARNKYLSKIGAK